MSVTVSDVEVGCALSATDTNIALTAGSLTVTGDLTQSASRTTQASGLAFNLANQGEVVSTVNVGGSFSTVASTFTIQNSVLEVTEDLTITGQLNGTAKTPTTTLSLTKGAQVTAANIYLNNTISNATPTNYQDANISTAGTMELTNSSIQLHNGSLDAGTLEIGADSGLTLGMDADALEIVNTALTNADQQTVDTMVVEATIGTANLANALTITGAGNDTVGTEQTEVAIQTLNFSQGEDDAGAVSVSGDASLMIGSTDIAGAMSDDMDAVDDFLARNNIDEENVTNYLVMGNTVTMGPANTFTVNGGTGLSIGAGTGVAIDTALLAANGAITKDADGNTVATLFAYQPAQVAEGETAPTPTDAAISPDAYFVVVNPLGNMKIKVAEGFGGEQAVLKDNVGSTNPLYLVAWEQPQEDAQTLNAVDADATPEPINSQTLSVVINEQEVSGQPGSLNSLATNTILDAASLGYGTYAGANRILELLSTATYANKDADYALIRNTVNQWALIGAAAHAHETGILATSMIVDSVWDHSSKLAASSHEEAKGDLWITLDWNHSRANDYKAGGLNNGYKMDLYGATFGADYDFANGLAAGLAVSVGGGESKAKGNNAGHQTAGTYGG
ncbi:MAG: hypothetical protein LUD38_18550, partial [Parabacteroides sp.]|nr:hypothetical protein [Parabacteroides sp.]